MESVSSVSRSAINSRTVLGRLSACRGKSLWKRSGPFMASQFVVVMVSLFLWSSPVAASCPFGQVHPAAPEETAQFSFLIGEWSCSIRRMQKDGTLGQPTAATWTGRYILDGWAIQDEWISTDAQGKLSHGMNVRSFNQETSKWDNRWLASGSLRWLSFQSEQLGDRMVMTSEPRHDAKGRPFLSRNVFHDISNDAWRWRQDRSFDGGETWLEGVAVIEARLKEGCGSTKANNR